MAVDPHGSLTHDGAEAFVAALFFAIQKLGPAGPLTAAKRSEAIRDRAASFTTLPASHQEVLAQARDTWNRVQAGCATMTQADRQQFVLWVLAIAFGEEATGQALASGSSGGRRRGDDGRQTIDGCSGQYAPGDGIDSNRTACRGMN